MPSRRYLPLPGKLGWADPVNARPKTPGAHPGLLFDKFIDAWSGPAGGWKPDTPKKEQSAKHKFFDEARRHVETSRATLAPLVRSHSQRRDRLVRSLGGESRRFQTSWRFVSGLGSGHPLEAGFIWHRTLGLPYLPGSSIKGLLRAWVEQWSDHAERSADLFGTQVQAGQLIVFEALPAEVPTLEVDILNPHYPDYYSSPEGSTVPPADDQEPVPTFFLTVAKRQPFTFALAPRPGSGAGAGEVTEGFGLLKAALDWLGAGAKTAVGYGRFTP